MFVASAEEDGSFVHVEIEAECSDASILFLFVLFSVGYTRGLDRRGAARDPYRVQKE